MPSRVIHYCVANEILKKANLDRNLFILGNLAPDANKDGEKKITHFKIPKEVRVYDYLDIKAFEDKYMAGGYNEMISGYYCHLLTDNLWLTEIYRKYVKRDSEEVTLLRRQQCYWDYFLLNYRLIKHYQLQNEEIKMPREIKITEISKKQLGNVVESLNGDFINLNTSDEPLKILDFELVLDFINRSAAKFLEEKHV